ncbi:MAG: anaerobic ribonucleoside-triphosphate reductase activating protein [Clostridia bacterium]|nr:anaerobic ribonucleoside-triphosphate reductase activating protein [Clostridia bacterium]
MSIVGFQKLTLLDFPGKTACTVFTAGCNLRCPFCHNADLVLSPSSLQKFSEDDIFSYLNKRKGLIDGICITGGEPMLMKDLPSFCEKIKNIGVSVKIDTNGSFPSLLKYIVRNGLCDYVAMDIKNTLTKYSQTVGITDLDVTPFAESIEFLKSSEIPHEFRTTVCKPFHTESDIVEIGKMLGDNERYFLQSFVDSGRLIGDGVSGFLPSEMKDMLSKLKEFVPNADIRGI